MPEQKSSTKNQKLWKNRIVPIDVYVAMAANYLKETNMNSTTKGLPPGYSRATFIVKDELLDQLRAVSYWERIKLQSVLEQAIERHLKTVPDTCKVTPPK